MGNLRWKSKTQKTICYAYCFGASTKKLARKYGWRSVRETLKQLEYWEATELNMGWYGKRKGEITVFAAGTCLGKSSFSIDKESASWMQKSMEAVV